MKIFDENGHLTAAALSGALSEEEAFLVSDHLCSCTHCALRFAESCGEERAPVPISLAQDTAARLRERKNGEKSAKIAQIFKLSIAAVFALTLFGSGVFTRLAGDIATRSAAENPIREMAKNTEKNFMDGYMQGFTNFAAAVNNIKLGDEKVEQKK